MRRTCTHCGIEQLVPEDRLSTGWNFLRCHDCGAMAAVQGEGLQNLLAATERGVRGKPRVIAAPPTPPPAPMASSVAMSSSSSTTQFTFDAPVMQAAGEPQITARAAVPPRPEAVAAAVSVSRQDAGTGTSRGFALPKFKSPQQMATIALALVCVVSGGYLMETAKKLKAQSPIISDQIVSAPSAAHAEAEAPAAAAPAEKSVEATTVAADSMPVKAVNRAPAVVSRSDIAPANLPRQVQVLPNIAVLRAGPGLGFRKIGIAKAELQMIVAGGYDGWTEVKTAGEKTAWIRSDLVKPLAQVASQTQLASGDNHERR